MPRSPEPGWTFFSNHGHVLFCLAADPSALMREVAERVGITERAVQRIVAELVDAGVLLREREGRGNRYEVAKRASLRHPIESHRTVGDLVGLIHGAKRAAAKPNGASTKAAAKKPARAAAKTTAKTAPKKRR